MSVEQTNALVRGQEILKYGAPNRGPDLRYYSNHVLSYDRQKRTPIWVAECITADNVKGEVSRRNVKFKPDPGVLEAFSAQNSDYLGSGWSRGHLNPAGDNKNTKEGMIESFYLSNVVPQNYENNAGFWNRFEMYCRDLTNKFSSVYIISGPLVLPQADESGKKFVKYQVIGENEVAVPTHLFKVVVGENSRSSPVAMGAFVVPNEPIGYNHALKDYEVDLAHLERISGLVLVPKLDRTKVNDLCKVDGCKLMEREAFELYFIGRKLESANTIERVEKVWAEVSDKKLRPSGTLLKFYQKKVQELQQKGETENENISERARG